MKDYLLSGREMLDPVQLQWINSGKYDFLFSCRWIRFNEKIKLAFFPDGFEPLGTLKKEMDLDDACAAGQLFIDAISEASSHSELVSENIVLDLDSIYLDEERKKVKLIYLPVVVHDEAPDAEIFVRRVYAVLTELFTGIDDGDTMIRQIEYQMNQSLGDFHALRETLNKRVPTEDDSIVLRGVNTEGKTIFEIGHEIFRIGTDPAGADGIVTGEDSVDAVHAEIGWNDINFYVIDLDSAAGTFVNDTRIAPGTQVPIGKGSIIRLGDVVFSVE